MANIKNDTVVEQEVHSVPVKEQAYGLAQCLATGLLVGTLTGIFVVGIQKIYEVVANKQ